MAVGSGAGSNLVQQYLFQNIVGATAVSAPLSAYGTIGFNDSGGYAGEGRAFSKARFMIEQVTSTPLAGLEITIYTTASLRASQTWWNALRGYRNPGGPNSWQVGSTPFRGIEAVPISPQGFSDAAGYVPGVAAYQWIIAEGPSEQSGTGNIANPMTTNTPSFTCSAPGVAFRAVVTGTQTAGAFNLSLLWIP